MDDLHTFTIPALIQNSVKKYGDLPAMSFVDEAGFSYSTMLQKISALKSFFERLGVQKGDKVAILGHNMPNWGIAYFGVTTMGAVAVPLLPDFSPSEIKNVIDHSESRVLIISERLLYKLDDLPLDHLVCIINLDEFSLIRSSVADVVYDEALQSPFGEDTEENDLAAIIYTSGTTGKQKGVMLSHKNIITNAIAGGMVQPVDTNDVFLSLLPLSHTYENTLGLFLPVLYGARMVYFQKPISPQLIAEALLKIRPTMLLTVPLIIEKMYRSKILPGLKKNKMVWALYRLSFFRKLINKSAGRKLKKAFGGRLKFFGVGGAKLDPIVEKFLLEAGFPLAIGYGLTETSPLLAGTNPRTARFQSTGPAINGVELKLNFSGGNGEQGEIWAKGPNVMLGYYKDPALTAEIINEDGWLRTGDIGTFDNEGFLFIKGRLKNTILRSNGENIYPEEIESVINNFKHVIESVVVEKKGELVALVHFNREELENHYRQLYGDFQSKVENKIEDLKRELQIYVNNRVNKFSRLQAVVVQVDPFQKTATQKIKRYLYI